MDIEVGQIQLRYTRQLMQQVQLLGISASGLKSQTSNVNPAHCYAAALLRIQEAWEFTGKWCRCFGRI
jgi:hypothetical protein